MTDDDQARMVLLADGATINEADVAWITAALSADLAAGYDSDPAIYREHVHDVVGALMSYRRFLVTAGPVRRRRLRADG